MKTFHIEPVNDDYRDGISQFLAAHWGSSQVVSRGRLHDAGLLPGFIALHHDRMVGLATYRLDGMACELVTLNSVVEGMGIGTALVAAVKAVAIAAACRRLWLITTNDNMAALRFYQKRGFHLVAVHPDALERSRRLKPQIPLVGLGGIPLRDEIELEMRLDQSVTTVAKGT